MRKVKSPTSLSIAFLIAVLTCSCFRLAVAADLPAPQVQWSKMYGGLIGRSIIQTAEQGYLILGSAKIYSINSSGNTAVMLIKTDVSGNQLWMKSFSSLDSSMFVLQTRDGGYALGSTQNTLANAQGYTLGHFYLAKLDSSGNLLWNRTYSFNGRNDVLTSFIQTSDNGFALLGRTDTFAGSLYSDDDILLTRVDANGAFLWNQTYGGNGYDNPLSFSQAADGGFAIVAYGESFGGGSAWFIRTNANGIMQSFKRSASLTNPQYGFSTSDGGFFILGLQDIYQNGGSDSVAAAAKTDSNGNLQWNQTYAGSDYSFSFAVQTREGGYIFADDNYGESITLLKVDGLGARQWTVNYSTTVDTNGRFLIETSDGGYALTGQTSSSICLLKTAPPANAPTVQLPNAQPSPTPNATLSWQSLFQGFKGASVVQTSDGGYAIVGQYSNAEYNLSSILIRTDGSGILLWSKVFRIDNQDTTLSFIVQTNDGGYVLAGTKGENWNYILGNQYCMMKTDPQGNVLWTREYYFNPPYGDILSAFIPTRDGGYALVGNTQGYYYSDSIRPIYMVKTDSAGNALWNKTIAEVTNVETYGTYVAALISTTDGGFSILGSDYYSNTYDTFKLVHIDSNGNAAWTQLYGSRNAGLNVDARAGIQTKDGGYLLGGGFSYWPQTAAMIVKTDAQGNMLWFKTYENEGLQIITAMVQTSDGYLLAGVTNSFVCIAKTDGNGNVKDLLTLDTLWTNTGDTAIAAIIPTNDEGYAFTGHYIGINGKAYDRIWLAKLSTQTGSQSNPVIPEIAPSQAFAVFVAVTSVAVFFKKRPARIVHPRNHEQ